jgi:predicted amidohydrolase
MTKLSTTTINVCYDKYKNMQKFFEYIDKASAEGADLVVFPEQALMGYLPSLVLLTAETSLDYFYDCAETIPDGECVKQLIKKAIEKKIYVAFGMTERDSEMYDVLYNTAVLVGPEGYIGKYRKVHLPLDELHIYHAGNEFPVFDTTIGKIGMCICYDKAFPESARELAVKGADIVAVLAAWPFENPNGNYDPKGDYQEDRMKYCFDRFDEMRALENQLFVVSSNQSGKAGDITYCGFSEIVDPYGKRIVTCGVNENIVFADVDIMYERLRAKTHAFYGLNFLKDRNPAAYTKYE